MPRFVYHGPPVYVVELNLEVTDGDEVDGSDALASASGFSEVSGSGGSRASAGRRLSEPAATPDASEDGD